MAVTRPARIVRSAENPRSYALKWCVFGGILAFLLVGLFSTLRETFGLSLFFFAPFLWFFAIGPMALILKEQSAYRAHGPLDLVLDEAPEIGGKLKGRIVLPAGSPRINEVKAELACTAGKTLVSGTTATLPVQHGPHGGVIEVDLRIPFRAPPSGDGSGASHQWNFQVKGEALRKLPLVRNFELEIFHQALPDAGHEPATPAAQVALVAANLVPLGLVLAGKESVAGLVMLYWAENLVIGCYTVLRMLAAQAGSGKFFLVPFFCVHFFGFCLIHGLVVLALFLPNALVAGPKARGPGDLLAGMVGQLIQGMDAAGLLTAGGLVALAALAASHGISFVQGYIRSGRASVASPRDSFFSPYPRLIATHLSLLAGGFLVARLGAPMAALVVLVLLKTAVDLVAYRWRGN